MVQGFDIQFKFAEGFAGLSATPTHLIDLPWGGVFGHDGVHEGSHEEEYGKDHAGLYVHLLPAEGIQIGASRAGQLEKFQDQKLLERHDARPV